MQRKGDVTKVQINSAGQDPHRVKLSAGAGRFLDWMSLHYCRPNPRYSIEVENPTSRLPNGGLAAEMASSAQGAPGGLEALK